MVKEERSRLLEVNNYFEESLSVSLGIFFCILEKINTMINNPIKLNNQEIFSDFDNHISLESNDRILFSAPFGTGKSTYLTEYFEHHYDNYFCFNLYPVNYSVSQNEDIFELIKFDLLLQLMGKYSEDIDLKNEDFSNVLSFQALFLKEFKLTPLLLSLIGESGKIGKSAKILIDEIKEQYEDYKNKFKNEEDFLEAYLQNVENKIGTVNEFDAYTSLITDLLERVKDRNKSKKSVLIIDDLDRLDPEHIFRLFNIFSVNFGKDEVLNKFGFEKIIFVCDIDNIKNIYKHKYGSNVDFVGYIDKFYSKMPFEFDNKKLIISSINQILTKVKNSNKSDFFDFKGGYINDNRLLIAIKSIIFSMLNSKLVNLRMLINVDFLQNDNFTFPFHKRNTQHVSNFPILQIFNLLKNYLGTYSDVEKSLKYMMDIFDEHSFSSNLRDDYYDDNGAAYGQIMSYCLPFLIALDENGELVTNSFELEKKFFECKPLDSIIYFSEFGGYSRASLGNKNFIEATRKNGANYEVIKLSPFEVLYMTFKECVNRRAIIL